MNSWPLSKTEARALARLNSAGLDCCLIYLTGTGIEKGILDATAPLRDLFFKECLHDFDSQKQGQDHKQMLPYIIFSNGFTYESKLSLYRPKTKSGDPRIWPYGLKQYAIANQVLAMFVYDKQIFFCNLSEISSSYLFQQGTSNSSKKDIQDLYQTDLDKFLENASLRYNEVSNDLLFKLQSLAKLGPLKADGRGDTSIGRTIETHLGISINSSPLPDYKGIEIKSSRSTSNTRDNLFAKVADWDISEFKSSREIVEAFGYERENENCRRLYCTVSTSKANSQGLIFDMSLDANRLNELFRNDKEDTNICAWRLSGLHEKLNEKHRETFWLSASELDNGGQKYFQLESIKHTRRPSIKQFDRLLECGEITMDHLIKLEFDKNRCKEKGPIFKITPASIDELFLGQPQSYNLK